MRPLLILAVVFMLLLVACKHSAPALPPSQMAPLLAELHIAEVYSGMVPDSNKQQIGKNYDSLAVWTKAIFARYRVSQEDFRNSMDWYRDNPSELDSLYARVLPILERSKRGS